MAKIMKFISVVSFILTIIFAVIYQVLSNDIVFSLMITFGTIMYHFVIRLAAGELINCFMRNKADYTKKWFYVSQRELKFYQIIKVKKWKNKMPTLWVGAFEVFFVTSILSAGFDLLFVFMQRFNRARILKMMTLKR